MSHHTKDKGDIAAAIAISDLTIKGYACFTPVVNEHLPFDIIAYKDSISIRVQAKYMSDGIVNNKTNWSDKNGSHTKYYNKNDFDYYALYIPEINRVIYPSIKFGGCSIRNTVPNSPTKFYWWEDFLQFTDVANKKYYRDFGITFENLSKDWDKNVFSSEDRLQNRKILWPSKEELEKFLWEEPLNKLAIRFGVSDKSISKWAKRYNIVGPPRGYWNKKFR